MLQLLRITLEANELSMIFQSFECETGNSPPTHIRCTIKKSLKSSGERSRTSKRVLIDLGQLLCGEPYYSHPALQRVLIQSLCSTPTLFPERNSTHFLIFSSEMLLARL